MFRYPLTEGFSSLASLARRLYFNQIDGMYERLVGMSNMLPVQIEGVRSCLEAHAQSL